MKCSAQLSWALLLGCWLQVHSFSHHAADAGKLRGSLLSLTQASRGFFQKTCLLCMFFFLNCSGRSRHQLRLLQWSLHPRPWGPPSPVHGETQGTLGLWEMQGPMVQTALPGRRVRQVPPSWFHCLWELQTLGCQCIPCRCL